MGNEASSEFATTIGTPQGDSLSPVLFTIYLEAALRDVRKAAPPRPDEDDTLPFEVVDADDTDFSSTSRPWLALLEPVCCSTLAGWFLRVNPDKTEWTQIARSSDRIMEEWRNTEKLGSLIGDSEDVSRRKQLATVAFRYMWSLWKRRDQVSRTLCLQLYNAFIMPTNIQRWNLGFDGCHPQEP